MHVLDDLVSKKYFTGALFLDEWVDGWMDGWRGVKAVKDCLQSNQNMSKSHHFLWTYGGQ